VRRYGLPMASETSHPIVQIVNSYKQNVWPLRWRLGCVQ